MVASGSEDKTWRLWNAGTGKQLGAPLAGHTGPVTCVALSREGAQVASGACDYSVRLWATSSQEPLKTLDGHTQKITGVAFSPVRSPRRSPYTHASP